MGSGPLPNEPGDVVSARVGWVGQGEQRGYGFTWPPTFPQIVAPHRNTWRVGRVGQG